MSSTYRCLIFAVAFLSNSVHIDGQTACTWSVVNNKNTPGGILQSGITNVPACQNACVKQYPSCQAIDYDNNNALQQYCWFSNPSSGTQNANGVDHYIATCGSGQITTQNPFSPQSTPSCYWNSTINTNSQNGVNHPEATTLDQCKSVCSNTGQNCNSFGFDWNPNQPGYYCWLSQNNILGNAQGITHYQLICPVVTQAPNTGSCSWVAAYNTHSIGGIFMSSYTSLQACEQGCKQDSACVAVDWPATNTVACWFSYAVNASEGMSNMNRYTWTCSASMKLPTVSGIAITFQLGLLFILTKMM